MDKLFKASLIMSTLRNFPLAFADKFGLVNKNIIYKIRNKKIQILARGNTEDMAEIVVVLSGYEYNLRTIKLHKAPLVVDLGGHIGTFSIFIASNFKKAKIFTFEPDRENYNILNQNIKLNNIKNVYAKNLAISDYIGKGFLKKENMNTDAYFLENVKGKKFNCDVSTLESAIKKFGIKKIDILKIDIEGGEYKLFLHKQTLNYILSNIHYIFMEYHDINKKYNFGTIKNLIERNFYILDKRKNILTLENKLYKNI